MSRAAFPRSLALGWPRRSRCCAVGLLRRIDGRLADQRVGPSGGGTKARPTSRRKQACRQRVNEMYEIATGRDIYAAELVGEHAVLGQLPAGRAEPRALRSVRLRPDVGECERNAGTARIRRPPPSPPAATGR